MQSLSRLKRFNLTINQIAASWLHPNRWWWSPWLPRRAHHSQRFHRRWLVTAWKSYPCHSRRTTTTISRLMIHLKHPSQCSMLISRVLHKNALETITLQSAFWTTCEQWCTLISLLPCTIVKGIAMHQIYAMSNRWSTLIPCWHSRQGIGSVARPEQDADWAGNYNKA